MNENKENKNKKNRKYIIYLILIIMLISSFYIEIYTGNEKQTIFNYVTSTLKLSAKEIRKRRKEKFHKDILDKLEKKYGEKFVIMSEYDGDVPFGDLQQYVVVRTQDDSHRFKVQVDFDTYSIYGDTYTGYYLYPKYEKYIKKILYDEYGENVTLDRMEISPIAADIYITKDTPIEKIPAQMFDDIIGNITFYVNEEMLANSTPKEVVYKIAATMAKNNVPTMMYVGFIKKDIYKYGINIDEYYKLEDGELFISPERVIENNKKFFVFFLKKDKDYEDPYYWIDIDYDYKKRKFFIHDYEEYDFTDNKDKYETYID